MIVRYLSIPFPSAILTRSCHHYHIPGPSLGRAARRAANPAQGQDPVRGPTRHVRPRSQPRLLVADLLVVGVATPLLRLEARLTTR